ncbi:hypothetical protein C4D60_Mb01t02430 [Musa balbisiana]|uniref:Stress-associated endoplasmic reticulum protein n=1 Tax=Musa balbisiana TaxID=52838 RepID=A0A4S8JJB4_MUSBA|nr:hypothetical protein C4D60_Mb01t02430 [Musa balbisiana]
MVNPHTRIIRLSSARQRGGGEIEYDKRCVFVWLMMFSNSIYYVLLIYLYVVNIRSMGGMLSRSTTTSRRLADRKIQKFQKNITKRGSVPETTVKKGNDYPVGPVVLGFFVFVVIGSSLFQIIRTATSGGMA